MMRIEGRLNAHFKQPDGSSRPGSDWAVGLKKGAAVYKVFVRTYYSANLAPKLANDENYLGQTVMGYLNDLLNAGWTPDKPVGAITIRNPPGWKG
jgi:hypothetical protein